MSEMTLEISNGTHVDLRVPPPLHLTIDQGRGPQGPGVDPAVIGDIEDLETEDSSSLVAAINELNMDGVSLTILYDNAKAG